MQASHYCSIVLKCVLNLILTFKYLQVDIGDLDKLRIDVRVLCLVPDQVLLEVLVDILKVGINFFKGGPAVSFRIGVFLAHSLS